MRKLFVSFGLLVYLAVCFVGAQNLRDRINKEDTIDDSFEDNRYGRHQPVKPKLTERNDDFDDLETTNPDDRVSKNKTGSDEMENELRSDLKAIRRFAQNMRPIATNMRRSMHSRRAMKQEVSVIMKVVKNTILSVIDTVNKYIPHLMPLTIFLRRFVLRIFGK